MVHVSNVILKSRMCVMVRHDYGAYVILTEYRLRNRNGSGTTDNGNVMVETSHYTVFQKKFTPILSMMIM